MRAVDRVRLEGIPYADALVRIQHLPPRYAACESTRDIEERPRVACFHRRIRAPSDNAAGLLHRANRIRIRVVETTRLMQRLVTIALDVFQEWQHGHLVTGIDIHPRKRERHVQSVAP